MLLGGLSHVAGRLGTNHLVRMGFRSFVVLSVACMVFMAKPILTGDYFGFGDVSILSPVVPSVGENSGVAPPQVDVTVDVLPWRKFNTSEIRSGHLPTWNPYNNSGVPQLANIQTAVLSPFTLPFYVLPMRLALLVSVYLLLMTAGLGMTGLMRHLGASEIAGLAAALVYMFSGYMVFWLQWPLASVTAFLPALVWVSGAFARAEGWRQIVQRGVGLSVVAALAVFAGHPETLFFEVLVVTLWYGVTVLVRRRGWRELARRVLYFAGAGLAAGALAAVQLLPFVEYLRHSSAVHGRDVHMYQSIKWLSVHAFPLAWGSPSMKYPGPFGLRFDFHEIVNLYIGIFALFLAAIGLLSVSWTRRRLPIFFGVVAGVLLLVRYNVLGSGELISKLPVLALIMPSRSAPIWALCVAVLAGFGIDALGAVPTKSRSRRRTVIAVCTGVLVVGMVGLSYRAWHLYKHMRYGGGEVRELAWHTLRGHLLFVSVSLAVGVACTLGVLFARSRRSVRVSSVGILVVLFLQGGFLLRGQNPPVPEKAFMEINQRVHRIADRVGDNQTLWIGDAALMPDVNLWIPTFSPENYDAIGIKSYEQLFRTTLRPPEEVRVAGLEVGILRGPYDPTGTPALQALGIRRIVSEKSYPYSHHNFLGAPGRSQRLADGGHRSTFGIRWRDGAPQQVVLYTEGVPDNAEVDVTISGYSMHGTAQRRAAVHGNLGVIDLPSTLPPAGVIDVEAESDAGAVVRVKASTTPVPGLKLIDSIDGYQIFAVPGPSGPAFSPASVVKMRSSDAARARFLQHGFDPTKQAVIETDEPNDQHRTSPSPGQVEVTEFTPREVSMTVVRDRPGWLVFNQNDYPGWRATVNGNAAEVHRANTTYMAVKVPRGTSTVQFSFRSASVTTGIVISIVTALIVLAGLCAMFIGRRKRR